MSNTRFLTLTDIATINRITNKGCTHNGVVPYRELYGNVDKFNIKQLGYTKMSAAKSYGYTLSHYIDDFFDIDFFNQEEIDTIALSNPSYALRRFVRFLSIDCIYGCINKVLIEKVCWDTRNLRRSALSCANAELVSRGQKTVSDPSFWMAVFNFVE